MKKLEPGVLERVIAMMLFIALILVLINPYVEGLIAKIGQEERKLEIPSDYQQLTLGSHQIDLMAADSCLDASGGMWITGNKMLGLRSDTTSMTNRLSLCRFNPDGEVFGFQIQLHVAFLKVCLYR